MNLQTSFAYRLCWAYAIKSDSMTHYLQRGCWPGAPILCEAENFDVEKIYLPVPLTLPMSSV